MIADNTGKALEPLKIWLKNHYKLRYRERQRIEAFVAYYAGTPAEPMPFVGRTEWLQQLDQWLAQNQSRFLLLSGSAGRGKSALLLHWLARLISQQPTLTLLFLPISIRFETSNELEGLRLLHAALCDYFADLVFSPNDKPDINDYRDRLFDGWERIANQPKQRYLLVIDGIDESANQWLLKEVLPRDLPSNWHLLLSTRHPPEETDGTTWLSDLGITGEQLELPPLTQSAIAEAIIQLGRPLDKLAEQQAFVEQLYRLTDQGDPLLLTLWIGQIWQNRETASDLTADKLQQLKPSFAGFYKIWLAEQQKIWKEQSIAIHPSNFNRLMQVLASAYGPLLLENELVDLLQ
jgi:NACHT domain